MDEAKRELVRAWLLKARNDLETARQISDLPDGHLARRSTTASKPPRRPSRASSRSTTIASNARMTSSGW